MYVESVGEAQAGGFMVDMARAVEGAVSGAVHAVEAAVTGAVNAVEEVTNIDLDGNGTVGGEKEVDISEPVRDDPQDIGISTPSRGDFAGVRGGPRTPGRVRTPGRTRSPRRTTSPRRPLTSPPMGGGGAKVFSQLDAPTRQRHLQLWASRQSADKLLNKSKSGDPLLYGIRTLDFSATACCNVHVPAAPACSVPAASVPAAPMSSCTLLMPRARPSLAWYSHDVPMLCRSHDVPLA